MKEKALHGFYWGLTLILVLVICIIATPFIGVGQ